MKNIVIMIVINEDFNCAEMLYLISSIGLRLSRFISTDSLLNSTKKVLLEKKDKELLSYYVLKDGVVIWTR